MPASITAFFAPIMSTWYGRAPMDSYSLAWDVHRWTSDLVVSEAQIQASYDRQGMMVWQRTAHAIPRRTQTFCPRQEESLSLPTAILPRRAIPLHCPMLYYHLQTSVIIVCYAARGQNCLHRWLLRPLPPRCIPHTNIEFINTSPFQTLSIINPPFGLGLGLTGPAMKSSSG